MVCCPASAIKKQLYLQKQMIQWRKKLNHAWWVCCNIRNRFIFSWASLSVRFIFPQLYSIACYIAKGKMESANLKFHQARQTFCNPIEEQPELILYWYICVFVYLCLCICVFVSFMYLCNTLCIWKREHGNLKFHQAGLTFHIPLRSRRNWAIFANTTWKLSAGDTIGDF